MFGISIHPSLYNPIYIWTVFAFCSMLSVVYLGSEGCEKLLKKRNALPALLLIALLIAFVGNRPITGRYMGDTGNYAHLYELWTVSGNVKANVNVETEWLWTFIMEQCKFWKLNASSWLTVIATGYFGLIFFALRRMLNEGVWFSLMFFLSAYSTFSYSINGIRNGLACSLVILAISYVVKQKHSEIQENSKSEGLSWNIIVAFVLGFLAFGIHRSTMLPLMSAIMAVFVIKNPKYALYFWLACIPASLIFGGAATNFFSGLGFDDRMSGYAVDASQNTEATFSHTGFRWDFLLYSSMPALLVWYINKKIEEHEQKVGVKKAEDVPAGTGYIADANSMRMYNVLATTYLLSNAFWIMVCRASFSNRFAYLSWFLYPILIAYAVIRLHIWNDQDRKAALILMAHAGFSVLMFLIGK